MSAGGPAPRRFAGRREFVTGAASGIGRAAALLFAAEGARVLAIDRDAGVEATAAAIRGCGGYAEALVADAGSAPDVAHAVGSAEARCGALHMAFANAGIGGGPAYPTRSPARSCFRPPTGESRHRPGFGGRRRPVGQHPFGRPREPGQTTI